MLMLRGDIYLTSLLLDHHWQHGFLAHCMIPILDRVTSTQPTNYTDILGLDHRVRNFDYPAMLQMVDSASVTPNEAMQQAMVACTREIGESPVHQFVPAIYLYHLCSVTPSAQELLHAGPDVVAGLHSQTPLRALGPGGLHERVQPNLGRGNPLLVGAYVKHAVHGLLDKLLLGCRKSVRTDFRLFV